MPKFLSLAVVAASIILLSPLSPARLEADHHGHSGHDEHHGGEDAHHGSDEHHDDEHVRTEWVHLDDDDERRHRTELGGLVALHAWTQATTADDALVFVELENVGTGPVLIEGAETDAAESAQLVGFELVDGKDTYQPISQMPIQAGRTLMLEPGAMAIQLDGLKEPLVEGEELDLHLVTEHGELGLHVAVEAADASQHSHAGHAH